MTVTIYANGMPIPEDQLDKFQITNPALVAFLYSVKKRIIAAESVGQQPEVEVLKIRNRYPPRVTVEKIIYNSILQYNL